MARELPGAHLARSWTTRPRREGEPTDAYRFVDHSVFEAAIERGAFLEWAAFNGNLYGTPRDELGLGEPTILEIDVQGARAVRALDTSSVVVGVLPPSFSELARRMRQRGDGAGHIERRLELARREVGEIVELADRLIVNDRIGRALGELLSILGAQARSEVPGG